MAMDYKKQENLEYVYSFVTHLFLSIFLLLDCNTIKIPSVPIWSIFSG